MGRVGAALYAGGGALALLWLALPHPDRADDLLLLVVVVLAFVGAQCPLSNLYLSMLHRLGIEAKTFSTAKGTMTGLELA